MIIIKKAIEQAVAHMQSTRVCGSQLTFEWLLDLRLRLVCGEPHPHRLPQLISLLICHGSGDIHISGVILINGGSRVRNTPVNTRQKERGSGETIKAVPSAPWQTSSSGTMRE